MLVCDHLPRHAPGSSSRIRKKALRDPTYVLKDILLDGRRDEQSTYQARDIESKESKQDNLNEVRSKQQCHFCGGSYPHSKGLCPAKGKDCRKCGKRNHFAKVCRSKQQQSPSDKSKKREQNNQKRLVNPLNTQTDSDSSSNDYLYAVNNNKTPNVRVKVCKHSFDATLDTGATINVIDHKTYEKMDGVNLKKTNVKAFAYNAKNPVKFAGKFEAIIETRKCVSVATIYVAKTPNSGNLISSTTAQDKENRYN